MIPPCNIRYVSRVKWSNTGKGVAPSPTPWCSSYWKGSLLVALDYSRQLYLLLYMYKNVLNNLPLLICHKTKPNVNYKLTSVGLNVLTRIIINNYFCFLNSFILFFTFWGLLSFTGSELISVLLHWSRYTSAGRLAWYTLRFGWVLAFVAVGRGRLTWVPGKPIIRVTWLKPTLPGPQGAVLPGSRLLRHDLVYCLVPEATRPKAFFEPSGVSGLRLLAWFSH